MSTTRGVTPLVAVLLAAVVVLAASTAYFGYVALQSGSKTGTTGLGGNSVFPAPSFNALAASGATGTSPSNSISVSGAAQMTYTPNEALLSVSVVASNKTAQATTQTDAAITGRVIRALNAIGISNSSIQTAGYSLYPNYSSCSYGGCVPQILGFTVTNSLLVNLTSSDPRQLGLSTGRAIDTAVGAGANQVSLQFAATASLLSSLNTEALQQAISSASAQAHVIANSLGVSISGVISATEGYSYYPYPQQYYGVFAAETINSASSAVTPVMPGTQTVYASVQVVYAIA